MCIQPFLQDTIIFRKNFFWARERAKLKFLPRLRLWSACKKGSRYLLRGQEREISHPTALLTFAIWHIPNCWLTWDDLVTVLSVFRLIVPVELYWFWSRYAHMAVLCCVHFQLCFTLLLFATKGLIKLLYGTDCGPHYTIAIREMCLYGASNRLQGS